MNILIRADSSSTIGTGHIMRDLVLAKHYPNDKITFATQNLDGNINHKIIKAGYKIEILESNDIEELDNLIKKLNVDLLIIDHYEIDYNYEKQLKIKNPTLKILSFDDTYEKHYCDILLNHNISADKKRYKNLVPDFCELRCGAKYTLLRDEFHKEKKKLKNGLKIQNSKLANAISHSEKFPRKFKIFLSMGGSDHKNLSIKILKVLKSFENIKVFIATTTANKNLDSLKKYSKNKKWIKLHINSNKIAKLMAKSDLAIIPPSVTVNEVYFLGIPFIAIKTANNQKDMYKFLKKKGFYTMDKFDNSKLKNYIIKKYKNKRGNRYIAK